MRAQPSPCKTDDPFVACCNQHKGYLCLRTSLRVIHLQRRIRDKVAAGSANESGLPASYPLVRLRLEPFKLWQNSL